MTDAHEAKASRIVSQRLEAKRGVIVTCACERKSHFLWMYRCYYCGEFYCERCAPGHFGKTRAEYKAEVNGVHA